ncbi:MAG: aldehyde dehydrogenase family protein [Candidatus Thermoplasmatota archaeon]|nr:aldehyde dehydrogenase family protein [Candidatus Thermoplasmatota archaeon]
MPFENEITYVKYVKNGKEKDFNQLYDRACEDAKKYIGKEYSNIIGKEIQESNKIKHVSPVDGHEIGVFQAGSQKSVDNALKMLKDAQKPWFKSGYVNRARVMLKAADLLSRDKFLISALLAYENGKNRTEAMADVDEAIDFLRYYAVNLIENQGFVRFTGKGYDNEESMSYMKPYGVFAVIAPFNFYAITVGMVAGPLTTGNSVLLKPSSDIPLTSYLYVKTLIEAGVPPENIAFISGKGSEIGPYITSHKEVAGILFTGSRDAGISIYRNAMKDKPKVVITEMGGKDTITVTSKADINKAVNGVYRAAFGYSGQKCSACSIAYIDEKVYDEFLPKIKEATDKLVVGDPKKLESFMGPVINREAVEKFKKYSELAEKGGKVLSGGIVIEGPGNFVRPTIVTDLPADSDIIKTELFLPFLAIVKVRNLDDAIKRINESDYGLTGGIFTEDPMEIQKYFDEVEVGTIYANRERGGSTGAMVGSQPFVGWKLSGISGKGTGSFYYLQQFLREQSQTIAH